MTGAIVVCLHLSDSTQKTNVLLVQIARVCWQIGKRMRSEMVADASFKSWRRRWERGWDGGGASDGGTVVASARKSRPESWF
jgi:hypothetical protein